MARTIEELREARARAENQIDQIMRNFLRETGLLEGNVKAVWGPLEIQAPGQAPRDAGFAAVIQVKL